MRRTSLSNAKARLSELVDGAEHHHATVVILRHGKPAAALVPVEAAVQRATPPMTRREAARFLDALLPLGDPDFAALDDLGRSRR